MTYTVEVGRTIGCMTTWTILESGLTRDEAELAAAEWDALATCCPWHDARRFRVRVVRG